LTVYDAPLNPLTETMIKNLRVSPARRQAQKAVALAVSVAFSTAACAADPVLNAFGESGGLVIPYGFVLPTGTFEAQYNNYIDPRYGQATGSQVYWGALGLLPYVEASGGLANYPANVHAPYSGADHFILRHLMGDLKVEVPHFFQYQPDVAFGISDVGGQTHFFRSRYGVVSQVLGPATLTVGYGSGDRLDGVFGGAELSLWHTGLSLLAEDDSRTPYAGARYRSPGIRWLADASIVGTVTRSLRTTDGVTPRTSVSIAIQIPLGKRFSAARCDAGLCEDSKASVADAGTAASSDAASPDTIQTKTLAGLPSDINPSPDRNTLAGAAISYTSWARTAAVELADAAAASSPVIPDALDADALDTIRRKLVAAGLERVRVGVAGHDLIVEYENHRYNQNEADALGIVLGVASATAPHDIQRVRAIIKKSDQPLGEVSVDRDAYARFMAGGSPTAAGASLTMTMRPTYNATAVAWSGNESAHGLTRFQILPVTRYLYGTEYGNFDYSVGANVLGFVPLWRGAELYASVIAPLFNSKNLDEGRVFSDYRLRGGLASAALTQSFWIVPNVFNVAAVGKFDFNYVGIENETTAFVPGRPDVVRLLLAGLHHEPGNDSIPTEKNAVLTYRWVEPAWNVWVEAGVARYVGGDKGPLITFTRWFDDVSFSLHAEHSGLGSFVGATVSFPLTPRQGMKPGITQVDGAQSFALDFRTRVGSTNYLPSNAADNLAFAYGAQQYLLNQGRFSGEYFSTQLYRMRDAYIRFTQPVDAAAKPTAQIPAMDVPEMAHLSCSASTAVDSPNGLADPKRHSHNCASLFPGEIQ
jgi:hypothetical protein